MKKSSLFILKSFLGPFVLTFFIAVFVLLMQFVWKWIDDMVGKGLEWFVIAKLLFYTVASLVPLALPLAILLSSLMTFGNMGENYELVAFRSAGISLQRTMKPLAILIGILSIVAFLFSNYVLPVANLKMKSLLYDIVEQKPAVNIIPGIFYNEIEGYTIKVSGKKSIDEVDHISDVMIYDHKDRTGNRKVMLAKNGTMAPSADKRYLEITLFDGNAYDDQTERKKRTNTYQHFHRKFKENKIRIDLAQFELNRTDEDLFKTHHEMLNLVQLDAAMDTIDSQMVRRKRNLATSLINNYSILDPKVGDTTNNFLNADFDLDAYLAALPPMQIKAIFSNATNISRGLKVRANSTAMELSNHKNNQTKHLVQWHKKLTLSFACIVLFFIGAPLGSIIRKGGLGMPVVVSVVFFLIFHVLSITGEKMTKGDVVDASFGMWMASLVLLPVGIFLTYKATTDSTLFDMTAYTNFFKKLIGKKG